MLELHLYICEVCGARWHDRDVAEACEAHKPEPKYRVGDKVRVYERYGEPEPDEVLEVHLGRSPMSQMIRSDLPLNEGQKRLLHKEGHHSWKYTVRKIHQLTKDHYGIMIDESCVYPFREGGSGSPAEE